MFDAPPPPPLAAVPSPAKAGEVFFFELLAGEACWGCGDGGGGAAADFLHFECAFGDAVAAEAEGAVEAGKAVAVGQAALGEFRAGTPIARDADGQQHRVI